MREHRLAVGHRDGYVFARKDGRPFAPVSVYKRADTAWQATGLARITLHECRHPFVSRWLEAGLPKERAKDSLIADVVLVNAYLAREAAAEVAV